MESYLHEVVRATTCAFEGLDEKMARYERMKTLVSSPPPNPLEKIWRGWVRMQREMTSASLFLGKWARKCLITRSRIRAQACLRLFFVDACVRWIKRRRDVMKKRMKKRDKKKSRRLRTKKTLSPLPSIPEDQDVEDENPSSAMSEFDISKSQALIVNRKLVTKVNFKPLETKRLGFSTPTPWKDIVSDFQKQTTKKKWIGVVDPSAMLHEMFYVLNTNLGTDRTVLELIGKNVTLEEMQTGRVWIQCKTPWDSIDKMMMNVVRIRGSGLKPKFYLGPRGIMRVPFTVMSKGVWSAPVWVNVGALPFANMYTEELESIILSPPARKLSSLLRHSYSHPSTSRPENMMKKLTPLLSPLCKTGIPPSSESEFERVWRYRNFSDVVFAQHLRWDEWWRSWVVAMKLEFSPELGVLRFVTSTKAGALFLSAGLIHCSSKVGELFRGQSFIKVIPREWDVFGELVFETFDDGYSLPRPTPATTLGGSGPCCIPFQVGPETFVWVNVLSFRHMPRNGKWSTGVCMYLFNNAMCLLRAVRGWVIRCVTRIRGDNQ
jgi:hypothetical protein